MPNLSHPNTRPGVTVLICAKNEAENLPYVLPKIPDLVDEILVVDGHSTDGTVDVVRAFSPRARVISQKKFGKGDAVRLGIRESRGDIVVTLDADGQTDPAEIPRFVSVLLMGYDFAKGTRLLYGRPPEMQFHKWLGNKVLVVAANILFHARYTDIAAGYRAFWKGSIAKVKIRYDGGEMDQELQVKILKMGLRVKEVPYRHLPRLHGGSRFRDLPQGVRNLLAIFISFFEH